MVPAYIEAITCIHVDMHCGFESCVYFVTSTEEENGGNWGMMADLLCVEGAAIDEGLVGLAQNRVERLENIEEEERIRKACKHDPFHPLNSIGHFGCLFEKSGSTAHGKGVLGELGIAVEDGDGERNVERSFAEKILLEGFYHEREDLILSCHYFFIEEHQTSFLSQMPILPQDDILKRFLVDLIQNGIDNSHGMPDFDVLFGQNNNSFLVNWYLFLSFNWSRGNYFVGGELLFLYLVDGYVGLLVLISDAEENIGILDLAYLIGLEGYWFVLCFMPLEERFWSARRQDFNFPILVEERFEFTLVLFLAEIAFHLLERKKVAGGQFLCVVGVEEASVVDFAGDDQLAAWGAGAYFDYLVGDVASGYSAEGDEVYVLYWLVSNVVILVDLEDVPQKYEISIPVPLWVLFMFLVDNGAIFGWDSQFDLGLGYLLVPVLVEAWVGQGQKSDLRCQVEQNL